MITTKRYQCQRGREIRLISTNHYGQCYSCGRVNHCYCCGPIYTTIWECLDKPEKITVNPEELVEIAPPRPYDSEKDFTLLLEACKKAGTRYIGPIREAFLEAGIDFPELGEINVQLDQDIDKAWSLLGYTKS